MNNFFNTKAMRILPLAIACALGSCTKVETDDDFVKGDAPPVPGGFTNSREIAATNLIGYWAFNGSLIDSVSGASGTSSNTSFGEGQKGQALQGGPSGYVTATPSAAVRAMTSYTISLWVNTPQNVGATGLVSLGNSTDFWGNINIFLENTGSNSLARFKTIYNASGSVRDNNIQEVQGGFNKWVQYLVTYDATAGSFKSYVNGTLVRTNTVASTPQPFANVGPIVFGALHFMTNPSSTSGSTNQSWAGYLIGRLDEVRIYNKALNDTEAFALFQLEKQRR